MKRVLYTWGTGAAWGRDLGCLPTDKKVRHHTSLSILVGEGDSQTHFLIDAGVPCVESMIDTVQEGNVPIPPPDAVFITHPHFDHNADLTKLVFSRERGWITRNSRWILTDIFFDDCQQMLSEDAISVLRKMKAADQKELQNIVSGYMEIREDMWKKNYLRLAISYPPKLPIVATEDCIEHPQHGIKRNFGFVENKLLWQPVSEFDVWYGIEKEKGTLVLWSEICDKYPDRIHPIIFKSLPVSHNESAPGASLFIFCILDTTVSPSAMEKKVVISGDFATIEESVILNPDLRNPDLLLIETNTLYTENTGHTNWVKNKELISKWFNKKHNARILLYHLSGYDDWQEGYIPRPMTDSDWQVLCNDDDFKDYRLSIDIASDGSRYEI